MLDSFVLTRSWRETTNGLGLRYWASSDRGPLCIRFTRQQAVFFVERDSPTEAGERRATSLKSLGGKPVDAVYFKRQRDLAAQRDRLIESGAAPLEADIGPANRFLMERFITGACRLQGEPEPKGGYLELVDPAVMACDYKPSLTLASIDIETDGLQGPLLSIALYSESLEQVFMIGEGPEPPLTTFVADERALLEAFTQALRALDPDVITGWNVIEFDLATLIAKSRALGIRLALGRDGSEAEVLAPRARHQPHVARIAGRVVLEGVASLRNAGHNFESFALQDVAQQLLGRGKHIAKTQDPVAEIRRMFSQDKPALAAYNLEDCRLVCDIFARTGLIEFLVQRQQLTGLPLDRQGGAVAAFDHLYLPRLHRAGYVAPSVGFAPHGEPSPGGYVMDSLPGLKDNVIVLDFKSLYPSIIRTFRIDPLGLAAPGDDPIEGFSGARFSRQTHILPGLIETLWAARDEARRRADAAHSSAIKILMNSFYGVLGTPACRFFDPKLASSITRRGHEIIHQARALLESRGLQVIYGDTDSLFVHLGAGRSLSECAALGEALARDLNRHFQDELWRQHRLESALEIQFETHYTRFFMPTVRGSEKGSKKRYAGLLERPTARGLERQVVFKGLEAVRTDWTPLAREFQRELYRRIFLGEPYEEFVRQQSADLLAGRLDHKLVYRKRLRRDLSDYAGKAPPHVQAARQLARPGRHVEYVVTVNGPEAVEMRRSRPDYQHYLARQLAPAADAILHCCGTSFATLGSRQLSLF